MSEATTTTSAQTQPKWRPLTARQRRVLGVLVEKAKTTPNNYPITLNALTSGCNQKNNREPVMELEPDEVEETLGELRAMGAIAEVFGDGRVVKYRHYGKDWLGVEGSELAVMAELLLRGEQTLGELRGRAARMAEIKGLAELQPLLDALIQKRLVVTLSPPGRGQLVTHGLYTEREMNDLRRQFDAAAPTATAPSGAIGTAPAAAPGLATPAASSAPAASSPPAKPIPSDVISEIKLDIAQLRVDLARLKQQVEELRDRK